MGGLLEGKDWSRGLRVLLCQKRERASVSLRSDEKGLMKEPP